MMLAELFDALNRIGGRLVRQDDAVVIDAGGKPLPPDIEAALATHQQALAQVVPVAAATNDAPTPAMPVEEPTLTNPADFFGSLLEIRARAAQQQAEASGASASETLSG